METPWKDIRIIVLGFCFMQMSQTDLSLYDRSILIRISISLKGMEVYSHMLCIMGFFFA